MSTLSLSYGSVEDPRTVLLWHRDDAGITHYVGWAERTWTDVWIARIINDFSGSIDPTHQHSVGSYDSIIDASLALLCSGAAVERAMEVV